MVSRFFATAIVVCLISCSSADAQIFGSRGLSIQGFRPALGGFVIGHPDRWNGPPPRYTNPEYYDYLNERYPKFTGGFHSSYFHNMGLPPGDIGPRGNGIYPTPW